MKKEESRQADSTVFEGMTSVRAVIKAYDDGISDRQILRLLVDEERSKSRAKELSWLSHRSKEIGFSIEYVSAETIDSLTTGNTHGGIIALCSERSIPPLECADLKKDGFYVMLDGIEDPYNFCY